MNRLYDAHCHLQDPRLSHCVDAVLQHAVKHGVAYFSCNGCCEDDWSKVKNLAERHMQVVPNFGLHPWWVHTRSDRWLQSLRAFLTSSPEAGLGECGLDQARSGIAPLHEQEQVMREQLKLAKELSRPVSVHCVKAFGPLQALVQEEGPFPAGLVLHSWAGSHEMVKQLRRTEGVYFSISGHSLGLSDKKLVPMLQEIPLDRLLLETDSPDGFAPLQRRGCQPLEAITPADSVAAPSTFRNHSGEPVQLLNQPANIRAVQSCLATLMGLSEEQIAEAAFRNASHIFSREHLQGTCKD